MGPKFKTNSLLGYDGVSFVGPAARGVRWHAHASTEADGVIAHHAERRDGLPGGLAGVTIYNQLFIFRKHGESRLHALAPRDIDRSFDVAFGVIGGASNRNELDR